MKMENKTKLYSEYSCFDLIIAKMMKWTPHKRIWDKLFSQSHSHTNTHTLAFFVCKCKKKNKEIETTNGVHLKSFADSFILFSHLSLVNVIIGFPTFFLQKSNILRIFLSITHTKKTKILVVLSTRLQCKTRKKNKSLIF